ncbi:MAG TPA: holo-ACP synthase [Candidatus Melainabacteria bacterium]|nr:holo-ACP synthase [Candidatus Melainabacteria bacterium]HMP51969.1 holo-ACP synthase [Candidatus Melainabacteria bacterium]
MTDPFKIGVDICSIKRVEETYERFGKRFLEKILTEAEAAYVTSSPKHLIPRLAGRFAAKEACAKALGTGLRGINWKEMEVTKMHSGEPGICLHARARARAEKLGLRNFQLSISHEREYAVAFVVASAAS